MTALVSRTLCRKAKWLHKLSGEPNLGTAVLIHYVTYKETRLKYDVLTLRFTGVKENTWTQNSEVLVEI